jgi:hypothetical protein
MKEWELDGCAFFERTRQERPLRVEVSYLE